MKAASLLELKYAANKVLDKATLKNITKIKDKQEQKILFEYALKSSLELKFAQLKEKVVEMERKKKDVFIIKTKLHLLGSKIHFFNATFYKKDFKSIITLFKEIENEVKHGVVR